MRKILLFVFAIMSFQNTAFAKDKMSYNIAEVKELLDELFNISSKLSEITGRSFTPDGHMVGSAGEVLAAFYYGLELEVASNKGFDAKTKNGVKVEVKTTGGKRGVSFNWTSEIQADKLLVLRLDRKLKNGFEEVYNGEAAPIFAALKKKKRQKNGQRFLSLPRLRELSPPKGSKSRLPTIR